MYNPIVDYIIRNSNWYKNQFEDAERILKVPQGLDVINLGSNPAKYGLDYSECGLSGGNFAVGPEAIHMDYVMLKKYHNYLRPDGPRLLLLLFCPFNLCKDFYRDSDGAVYKNLRYYRILEKDQIPNFDDDLYERMVLHPSKSGIRTLYYALRQRNSYNLRFEICENRLTAEQMKVDAAKRIAGWKREFFLNDLNPEHLSELVKNSIVFNSGIIDDIEAFCKNHNINVNIIIPPLSKELSDMIPQDFRERCFYSIIRKKNIPIYDYTDNCELRANENFLDSLLLNKVGRIKFTNRVIADIKNNYD